MTTAERQGQIYWGLLGNWGELVTVVSEADGFVGLVLRGDGCWDGLYLWGARDWGLGFTALEMGDGGHDDDDYDYDYDGGIVYFHWSTSRMHTWLTHLSVVPSLSTVSSCYTALQYYLLQEVCLRLICIVCNYHLVVWLSCFVILLRQITALQRVAWL
ncbi:hypothetical protein F5884DRAFT_207116 [Xylogone sp. PMI_703]|nr:hypothetical protein F5884DRAFT_207116 [Xylogone sp. PMI_703]